MLYAIRVDKRWGMTRNKRKAVRIAKRVDAQVYAHPDIPEISAWDWPTFIIGATRIH